ncbi:MAG TPA: biotin--[acetyl-CoA-carboxylase] ligase [Streptosporangiaceae bacterium]|nr:biotin--[acetyl-CoA-carboxylase] ligase [Streptosporangiaceae bacterium]
MSAAQPPTRPAVPLSAGRLRAAAIVAGGLWTDIRVVEETGSTNADVLGEARRGAPEGLVLAAEAQTAGRGRLGRTWQSLPGAALTFSVLLRPTSVPQAGRGWVPLLAGVAVAGALRRAVGVDARLKWPNDVLVADAKLAGILAEQAGDAIAVGIGINVRGRPQDLPVATATSLELHGAGETDRTELLAAVLAELETWYRRWSRSGTQGTPAEAGAGGRAEAGTGGGGLAGGVRGDGGIGYRAAEASGLRSAYLRLSATVGQEVQVWLPGGRQLTGTACDVDGTGRLVLRSATGLIAVSAGDVIHLR